MALRGTAMTSWKAKLNESQRQQLADYVRSMFDATPQ
jgi:hypothetical protein